MVMASEALKHALMIRKIAIRSLEEMRPYIYKLYSMTRPMSTFETMNFILDKEGCLAALSGFDQNRLKHMLVRDQEGNFEFKHFDFKEDHSTLTIDMRIIFRPFIEARRRFLQSVIVQKMPKEGLAKEIADEMATLSLSLYEGSYAFAKEISAPNQKFIDWKITLYQTQNFTIREILEAGKLALEQRK